MKRIPKAKVREKKREISPNNTTPPHLLLIQIQVVLLYMRLIGSVIQRIQQKIQMKIRLNQFRLDVFRCKQEILKIQL